MTYPVDNGTMKKSHNEAILIIISLIHIRGGIMLKTVIFMRDNIIADRLAMKMEYTSAFDGCGKMRKMTNFRSDWR